MTIKGEYWKIRSNGTVLPSNSLQMAFKILSYDLVLYNINRYSQGHSQCQQHKSSSGTAIGFILLTQVIWGGGMQVFWTICSWPFALHTALVQLQIFQFVLGCRWRKKEYTEISTIAFYRLQIKSQKYNSSFSWMLDGQYFPQQ